MELSVTKSPGMSSSLEKDGGNTGYLNPFPEKASAPQLAMPSVVPRLILPCSRAGTRTRKTALGDQEILPSLPAHGSLRGCGSF